MNTYADRTARDGVIAAVTAYFLWGLMPLYFLLLPQVSSWELLLMRVLWSVPFGALIIAMRGQWGEVARALRNPRTVGWLALAAVAIAANWLIYIIAVQNAQIFQASLGYYINPMIYVLVGVVFFAERLRVGQILAVIAATVGVGVLTFSAGEFPLAAIALALLFTAYGVIRKQVVIGGMPGLFIETLILAPFALVAITIMASGPGIEFLSGDWNTSLLLVAAGPVTVVPLLCFALATRRLSLTTIGFLQFIGPSMQFIIAVWSGEQLSRAKLICFGFIWLAVLLFSADAIHNHSRQRRFLPN